jgi:hypothetical protein
MVGLSTIGSISLGCAFVAGKNLVPNPAAGIMAFLTFISHPPILLFIIKQKLQQIDTAKLKIRSRTIQRT